MGILLKPAQTARELDDVFWIRRQVFSVEEGKFGGEEADERYFVDRFDAHPGCANLIAYDGDEPIATIRLNLDTGAGLPPEQFFDFSPERRRLERRWTKEYAEPCAFGSAGMLAVRNAWRRRRDVIRALLKLAAMVARSLGFTHILVVANHDNAQMYRRVGFKALGDKIWAEEIGNFVLPMAARFADYYARTVGPRLEGVALLKCFSGRFERVVYRAGERIFSENDAAALCYVVDVGRVKITTTNARDGKELVLAVLGPGEVFGEMALIDSGRRSANAIAEVDSEFIVLKRDDFMDGLREHPERLQIVLGFISDRLRRTDQFAKLLAYGSTEQRLVFALKNYVDSGKLISRPDGTKVLKASLHELAAAAGTDETDVIHFLDGLKAQGYCEYSDSQINFLLPIASRHQT